MIEAVVFDLYGTLIRLERDTRPYYRLARLIRPDAPGEAVRRSLLIPSLGIGDFATRLGGDPPSETADLEEDLRQDLLSARVFDDVFETLSSLREQGCKLGLSSNLAGPYKEPYRRCGLAPFFDAALFSCDVGRRKPESSVFKEMAEALGCDPARVVMIGDSRRSDYDGARAAGMAALHLCRGCGELGAGQLGSLRDLPQRLELGEREKDFPDPDRAIKAG
ncbi:HAD family hydrolase [Paludisphaera rhizosphaerae]|uniref:HAD family hydrolase n=1 Tax=Paludisphaera rhizosphaerae TaxID=2711216 RepID=UPI0013ED964E|nr:HAD family hydrolase [Paludisphaera rhizosphaerae]